jgi:membrane protein DedA with SNARE-associated domain
MYSIKLAITIILVFGLIAVGLVYWQQYWEPLPAAAGNSPPAASNSHRVLQDLEHSLAKAKPLLERYSYAAVFVAVMVEGMGIPAPGQILVIASALEAAKGKLHLGLLLTLVTLAALFGNSIGYLIGHWGSRPLLKKLKVNADCLQRIERFFDRYGGGVIALGRFFDGLRQLNGIVAGMLAMPWWLFTVFNLVGAVLWTGLWGLGTYFLEKDIHIIVSFFWMFESWIMILSLTGLALLLSYLLWRRWSS